MMQEITQDMTEDMTEEITYTQIGDYLYPNIVASGEDTDIGTYGEKRRRFLMKHETELFDKMVMDGTLWTHLRETDEAAWERLEVVMKAMVKKAKENGEMPDQDSDPLGWAGMMNMIQAQAEEVAVHPLIYAEI